MALVAAGLEGEVIGRVELVGPLGSLKELIEAKAPYAKTPELFGFGLLRDFDVAQLAALVAPRPLTISEPSDRARGRARRPAALVRDVGHRGRPPAALPVGRARRTVPPE